MTPPSPATDTATDTSTDPTAIPVITVAALTYRRPVGLERLLGHLGRLEAPDGHRVRIVIVDNDPEESGRQVVEAAALALPFEVTYVAESRRGISAARNAAVDAARDATFLAFIDDDEWPEPSWLVELVATHQRTGADVVAGWVIPVFDEPPPTWVLEGGFFERRRHFHNERINYATTSNVLIHLRCLADRPQPFDHAFGLSGGEDTHLFAQLRLAGHRLHWCDRAPVREAIPASRVTARWILARERRRGQTLSLSLRARGAGPGRMARRAANGLLEVATGAAVTLVALPRGRAAVLVGLKRVVFGVGMLSGLAGRRYQEYAETHGA